MLHIPVMVDEVVRYLLHENSSLVLDGTLGAGGHTRAILDASATVSVIGVDRDGEAIAAARDSLRDYGERVTFVVGSYADADDMMGDRKIDGALVDFGISSLQLDSPERGFSYSQDGPLDMRMGREGRSAKAYIDRASEAELAKILRTYGEVRRASRIARAIRAASERDEMNTTKDLKNAVDSALRGSAPPALLSKIFQAIRIAVNEELENIKKFLERILHCLDQNARIVCISYHSLEDRIVKDFFKRESMGCLCPPRLPVCACGHEASLELLTRRVVKPGTEEVVRNPRSRSARLRAAKFIAGGGPH